MSDQNEVKVGQVREMDCGDGVKERYVVIAKREEGIGGFFVARFGSNRENQAMYWVATDIVKDNLLLTIELGD